MTQENNSEIFSKIRWWFHLRWIGLILVSSLFFKLFYGLPLYFFEKLIASLLLFFFLGFIPFGFVKVRLIQSEKKIQVLTGFIFIFELLIIYWLAWQIFPPIIENLPKIPVSLLLNLWAFLYFLVIVSSGVILGITTSIFTSFLAMILFLWQKFSFLPADLKTGQNILTHFEVIVFFYFGVFLVGYLTWQTEAKKRELDEINFELLQKIKDLEGHRKDLIQLEKRASLHQLAVSLNHEINNPLTSILGNAEFFLEKIEKKPETFFDGFEEAINDCLTEAKKIKDLLRKIRKISEPIVSEYIPGIKMIDIEKAIK